MPLRLVCILGSLFFAGILSPVFAQSPEIDSLEQRLQTELAPKARSETLLRLTNLLQNYDLGQAESYGKQAIAFIREHDQDSLLGYAQIALGRCLANSGRLDEAAALFRQSHNTFIRRKDSLGMARALQKREYTYQYSGNYDSAIWATIEALRLFEARDARMEAGALQRTLGDLFYAKQEYEAGLEKARLALEIHTELEAPVQIALDHEAIASNLLQLERFEEALFHEHQAIAIFKQGSAGLDVAIAQNNLGNILKRKGDLAEAEIAYRAALDNPVTSQYPGFVQPLKANLGEIKMRQKNYREALPYLLESEKMIKASSYANNLVESHLHLANTYEGLGDYPKALEYYKQFHATQDSLLSREKEAFMEELSTQYETEKKETQITLLNQKRRTDRQFMILGGIGLLLIVVAAGYLFHLNEQRKKANLLLELKNRENELLLKEIHHRVKNNLQVISSLLRLQSAHIDNPDVREAVKAGEHRVKSMALIHQKLYQHEDLAAIEMKDYLENLCSSLFSTFGKKASHISCTVDMNPLLLDVDTAVPLGLIVNELVTNSIKYAFPDEREGAIRIALVQKNEQEMQLIVSDNGVGQEVGEKAQGTSFGTKLVNLLTMQLDGNLQVTRTPAFRYELVFKKFKLGKASLTPA